MFFLDFEQKKDQEFSVAYPDPGFGIRCVFDPWIRDGMGKKSGSRSEIRIRIIFLSALKPFFGVKILKFFEADPGWQKLG
jgi:hypothetical protein